MKRQEGERNRENKRKSSLLFVRMVDKQSQAKATPRTYLDSGLKGKFRPMVLSCNPKMYKQDQLIDSTVHKQLKKKKKGKQLPECFKKVFFFSRIKSSLKSIMMQKNSYNMDYFLNRNQTKKNILFQVQKYTQKHNK